MLTLATRFRTFRVILPRLVVSSKLNIFHLQSQTLHLPVTSSKSKRNILLNIEVNGGFQQTRSGHVVFRLGRAPISKLFAPSAFQITRRVTDRGGQREEERETRREIYSTARFVPPPLQTDQRSPSSTDRSPSTLSKPRVATFSLSVSLSIPFPRHPQRLASLWTKTLPNSIATLCSLGLETRAPLFVFNFQHPLAVVRTDRLLGCLAVPLFFARVPSRFLLW